MLDTSFQNLTFAKLYAEVFAEAGMVGNFSDQKRLEPWSRYGELSGPERDGVLADVTPTLMDLAGIELAEGMSGHSLLED